jgi:hypothetical protein
MVWLADEDPTRIEALERMPLIDYWHLLNRKLASVQPKKVDKVRSNARNSR